MEQREWGLHLGHSRPDPTEEAGLASPQQGGPPAIIKGQGAPAADDDWEGEGWALGQRKLCGCQTGRPSVSPSTMGSLTPDPAPFEPLPLEGYPHPTPTPKEKGGRFLLSLPLQ